MAAEIGRPYDNLENIETRRGNSRNVIMSLIIAAFPSFIAAVASIWGVLYDKDFDTRLANQMSMSNGNRNLLNEIITQQIIPYRNKLLELLDTIDVEFNRESKSPKAKINKNLVQALAELHRHSETHPYKWDKNVLQETEEYNNYVADAYSEISTGNALEEKKQNYYHEASKRRKKLIEAIDYMIDALTPQGSSTIRRLSNVPARAEFPLSGHLPIVTMTME